MKVDRICTIGMIDEANDCFTPLFHLESWSRDGTIVTDVPCFLARVDFDIDRLDVNLIVINIVV